MRKLVATAKVAYVYTAIACTQERFRHRCGGCLLKKDDREAKRKHAGFCIFYYLALKFLLFSKDVMQVRFTTFCSHFDRHDADSRPINTKNICAALEQVHPTPHGTIQNANWHSNVVSTRQVAGICRAFVINNIPQRASGSVRL